MGTWYDKLVNFGGAKGLSTLMEKWETLSANLTRFPASASIVLPDLLVISQSSYMVSRMVEYLAGYMESKKNLMEFYGDVRYFEFMLNYCSPQDSFTEIHRFIDEVDNSAGFRSSFKGIIHIRIDSWISHQEEAHFINFLDYLAQNTGDWMVVFSVTGEDNIKIKSLETVLSMFLRIEKIILTTGSTKMYVNELEEMLAVYDFQLNAGAKQLLNRSIDILRKNKYFDASYTIRLLCNDIVYEVYSHKIRDSRLLTAEDLKMFESDGAYIRRTIQKINEGKRIGFLRG